MPDPGETDEERWLTHPTDEALAETAKALIECGRAALPIKIEGSPLEPSNPNHYLPYIEADEPNFVRMWLAALLHRTIDGYESTLFLWDVGLDLDARAHIRIAFEHLCVFAWIAAEPIDPSRPMRIGRHGMGFYEKQMAEMAQHSPLTKSQLLELGFAIGINKSDLEKPPSARALCEELDLEWAGKLPEIKVGSRYSFSAWYSYLFRGASAFVHPTSAGIEPLLFPAPGLFLVQPSRKRERRVLELCTAHLSVALAIASLNCPELIDEESLQVLSRFRDHPDAEVP